MSAEGVPVRYVLPYQESHPVAEFLERLEPGMPIDTEGQKRRAELRKEVRSWSGTPGSVPSTPESPAEES